VRRYAATSNSAFNSGRIADSLVEWHLEGEDQRCLVPVSDWSYRARIRDVYRPYHDREILQAETEVVAAILAAIDQQGPLSSLEFEDPTRYEGGSWYGSTRTKRALRAMWVSGIVVTHHRKNGRHYYDRPERVIPPHYYAVPPLLDEDAYHRWIVARRFQATGLLRPNADQSIWSACGDGATRKRAIAQLLEEGTLTSVHVGEKKWPYYMLTNALPWLDIEPPSPRVIFLGPLDSILWDRKAVMQLFDFDYVWEVYKPLEQRRWGYYILPVFYFQSPQAGPEHTRPSAAPLEQQDTRPTRKGQVSRYYGDRFIARMDSRLEGKTWTISHWWWEPDVELDTELLEALRVAMEKFLYYLRADDIRVGEEVDGAVREAVVGARV
jgi:uncharacterized protein